MVIAWVMFGRILAVRPEQPHLVTRYRWPIRFRFPWL
jgi:hypothetical protein